MTGVNIFRISAATLLVAAYVFLWLTDRLTGQRPWLAALVVGVAAVVLAGSFRVWAGLAVAVVVTAAARVLLVRYGKVPGSEIIWAINLGLVALFVAAIAAYVMRSTNQPEATFAARLGALGGLLAAPAAAVALLQVVAPISPPTASAPVCRNAAVGGARFLATTRGLGVNARSGPSTSHPQTQRFGGDCTLGFDGYCIGEPTDDFAVHLPDQRWLILHRAWGQPAGLVASGKILSQSPEEALGKAPAEVCAALGGLHEPGPVSLTNLSVETGDFTADVSVKYGQLVGFAFLAEAVEPGYPRILSLADLPKRTDPSGKTNVTWKLANNPAYLAPPHGGTAHFTLLVAACVAPGVAQPDAYQTVGLTMAAGEPRISKNRPSPTETERDQLAATACRVSPDAKVEA